MQSVPKVNENIMTNLLEALSSAKNAAVSSLLFITVIKSSTADLDGGSKFPEYC